MKLLKGQIEVPIRQMPLRPGALKPHPVGGSGDLDSNMGGAPVAFGASSGSIASGTSVALDETLLGSGFRTPYFIDEIRVTAFSSSAFGVALFGGLAGLIRLAFQCGPYAFASHFPNGIPMGLLGPRLSVLDGGTVATNSDRSINNIARIRFPLPKPLFMPAGDVLRCTVFHNANPASIAGQPNATVNVTYLGRMLPQGVASPLTRQVPWLAFFQNFFSNTNGSLFAQTTDDFRNTFTKRVIVQRLVERCQKYDGTNWIDSLVSGSPGSTPFVEARIDDSLGYAIVPQFVPIGPLFDEQSRSVWTFSRSLGPREQFNMALRLNGSFAATGGINAQVGMVGYRDEVV